MCQDARWWARKTDVDGKNGARLSTPTAEMIEPLDWRHSAHDGVGKWRADVPDGVKMAPIRISESVCAWMSDPDRQTGASDADEAGGEACSMVTVVAGRESFGSASAEGMASRGC